MGITKTQLLASVGQIKTYVDGEVAKVETTGETTYTDEEITSAVADVLKTATE